MTGKVVEVSMLSQNVQQGISISCIKALKHAVPLLLRETHPHLHALDVLGYRRERFERTAIVACHA